ncbi:MAG: choice-of-anchor J domain-containing protein [Pyrinomonadaceae bacterium]
MSWMPTATSFLSAFRSVIILSVFAAICFISGTESANGQAINEDFAYLPFLLADEGWATVNHSDPLNQSVSGWSQCAGANISPAQAGSADSCVQADFTSVAPDTAGTINNWLIGPNRVFTNGDTLSFYTRTVSGNFFGDRLQVRLSTNGASTNVGMRATDVGDFSTLLLDISPTYQVGQYPEVWTQYTITLSGIPAPTSGRFAFRYFIENGGSLGDIGYVVGIDSLVYTPIPVAQTTLFDYDHDGRSDISVFRPSTGDWYVQRSTAGFFGTNFGAGTDRIVPADYDGDDKTDVAVYRPSTGIWYILNSSNGTVSYYGFGASEDLPAPADYEGDGRADVCVFRPSTGTWYRLNSSNGGFVATQFGANGDKPTVGDFDGDGKADVAIFRPSSGAWYQLNSSNGTFFGEQFGVGTDKIVPADYDGDGKTDIAIYRPSETLWYVKYSATSTYVPYVFGLATDIPVAADFDGDGRADIALFRPTDGHWYIVNSSNGTYTIYEFGQNGDKPTQSAFSGN